MAMLRMFLLMIGLVWQTVWGFAPIADRLDRLRDERWQVMGGEWSVADGHVDVAGDGGSKLVLRGVEGGDFQLDVEVRADASGVQAGVVFRGARMAEGLDGFRGYYAGVQAGANRVVWGAVDPGWREIASRPQRVDVGEWVHVRVRTAGDNVRIYVDGKPLTEGSWPVFDGVDPAFRSGVFALRAVGGQASFRRFIVRPWQAPVLRRRYTNPVQPGCADPVVLFRDGIYHAYVTHTGGSPRGGKGIRLHTSRDLVNWTDRGFALDSRDSWGNSKFWAPDIVERGGVFHLYYAAEERLCVATAKSPLGPFRQEVREPMLPESLRIDGHVFEDDDGRRYFYYVTFNNGNEIWGGRLNDDMRRVDPGSLRMMLRADQPWERHQAPIVEGPAMLKHKGTYYLTYSGSHYEHPEYAVGYATSRSPLGPWKKYEFNPVMKSTAYARGTAHHCFVSSPDGKETFIVYHRHQGPGRTNPRQLAIDRVRFAVDPHGGLDVLQVHGPTSSPQPLPSGVR